MKYFLLVVLFIVITTLNFEYLINRVSSTALSLLAVAIEIAAIYFIIYKPFKKIKL